MEVTGFTVGVANAFYVFKEGFRSGMRHCFGRWVVPEQGRGDHVHSFVGTLGAEHYRHQKLKGIAVSQFRFSRGVMGLKVLKHLLVSFRFLHPMVKIED